MNFRFFVLATSGLLFGFLFAFYAEPKLEVAMLMFDHSQHQALACQVCHRGVMTQEKARVPGTALCAKCHTASPDTTEAGLTLWAASEKKELRWPVSYKLPTHTYFSHQTHAVAANLKCETCHGNMRSQQTVVSVPLKRLEMDSCLACHRKENASTDCASCHR